MSAATNALRRDEALEVVAFERGSYTSYSACGIPYYVGGLVEDAERLVARSPSKHRANGIDVRTETEVVEVDLDRRELTLADGSREGFAPLVIASGGLAPARSPARRARPPATDPGCRRDRAGAHARRRAALPPAGRGGRPRRRR